MDIDEQAGTCVCDKSEISFVNPTAESHPTMMFWLVGIGEIQQCVGIRDWLCENFGWKDIWQTVTKPGNIVPQRSLKKNSAWLCGLPENISYSEVGRKSCISKAKKDTKDGMFLIARLGKSVLNKSKRGCFTLTVMLHRGFTPTFPSLSSANSGFGLDSCRRLHKFTCCKKPSQNSLSLIGIKALQRRCLCIEFESPTVGSSWSSIRSSYEINVSAAPDIDPCLHTQVILLIIFTFAVWNLSLKIYELVDIALLEVASLSFLWLMGCQNERSGSWGGITYVSTPSMRFKTINVPPSPEMVACLLKFLVSRL